MSEELNRLKEKAKSLAKSGHLDDSAISTNKKILELEPSSIAAYARLGKIYSHQGDHDSALKMYEKVLTLDPGNKIAKSGINACKKFHGDPDTTIKLSGVKTFNEAFSHATSFKDNKDYLPAISAYRRALELTDNSKDLMVVKTGLAAAYSYAGLHNVSERMYRELLSIEPGNNIMRVGLAGTLNSMGKYPEAEELCKIVLMEQPNNAFAKTCLASVRINKSSRP